LAPRDFLTLINPINTLPCVRVDRPLTLVDDNHDGRDDHACRRRQTARCLTREEPPAR
jgi:hypothetical protein